MQREIYVMYDSVSRNFGEPFTMANTADLCREFEQMAKNPAIPAYAIRDVVFLHLGSFVPDPTDPRIIPTTVPSVVLRGDNLNVDEVRKQSSSVAASASELHACEDC